MTSTIGSETSRPGREFPVLGSCDHPVTPTTRARYFVTGPFTRTAAWSSARLMHFVHAKEMGSATTVCGVAATTWETLWDVPFSVQGLQAACPACRQRVDDGCA